MKIGFIGTGSMGNPVARNLQAAGHQLFVHDLDKAATENLVAAGATWCENAASVAVQAEIILLSLPSQIEVESV